jgi:hypothetical protein
MRPSPIKHAYCHQCNRQKPIEDFPLNPLKKNGRKATCQSCVDRSRERSRVAREARLNSLVEAA